MRYMMPVPKDLVESLLSGLRILRDHGVHECEGAYLPNSFPNGTPDNPTGTHLVVAVDWQDPNEPDVAELERLGWWSEQDGMYWLIRTS
tara:strand:+ start:186 stop:452 length:267 start_codon:yes stop_codon:yes gene_type:complete